jgi:hypothetical protein
MPLGDSAGDVRIILGSAVQTSVSDLMDTRMHAARRYTSRIFAGPRSCALARHVRVLPRSTAERRALQDPGPSASPADSGAISIPLIVTAAVSKRLKPSIGRIPEIWAIFRRDLHRQHFLHQNHTVQSRPGLLSSLYSPPLHRASSGGSALKSKYRYDTSDLSQAAQGEWTWEEVQEHIFDRGLLPGTLYLRAPVIRS